jgi:hypothetical protein
MSKKQEPVDMSPILHGIPPLNLDEMMGTQVPADWDIVGVLGDIIMAQYIDENEDGEVKRGSVWIKIDMTRKTWRVAKVIKRGPGCSEHIKEGDLIQFPSDKGIPMVAMNKDKFVFLNESRIFAIVKPKAKS